LSEKRSTGLKQRVIRVLEEFNETGSPAIKSRSGKLLRNLKL
jgi:hypothetical protein